MLKTLPRYKVYKKIACRQVMGISKQGSTVIPLNTGTPKPINVFILKFYWEWLHFHWEATLQCSITNFSSFHSQQESTLPGKNLLSRSKFFPLRVDPFLACLNKSLEEILLPFWHRHGVGVRTGLFFFFFFKGQGAVR